MLNRFLAALLTVAASLSSASAFDIKSTTVPGRAPPSLGDAEIGSNRADGRLFYKSETGTILGGLLPDLDVAGNLKFRNGLKLGRFQDGKFTSQPQNLELPGSLTMTGPGALPVGTPGLGELSINAPTANHYLSGNGFFTRGRLFVTNLPNGSTGGIVDWLGGGTCNAAGGGPNHYAYGSCATGTFLSSIGDVAVTGAVRTSDIKRAEDVNVRFPAAGNFQSFNDNVQFPRTAWPVYVEGRRVTGAGQSHPEFAAVELQRSGVASDVRDISPRIAGPNAVFSFTTAGLSIESGGNCTIFNGLGGCWNGFEMNTAIDSPVALNIYNNGAKFRKGFVWGDTTLTGCDGTGNGQTCTMNEAPPGAMLTWVDREDGTHSTRQSAKIYADMSKTAPPARIMFGDGGVITDGYGPVATLNVKVSNADTNGIQIIGGSSAGAPARIVAVGDVNAPLALAGSGNGIIQMQSPPQIPTFKVANLPACNISSRGLQANVDDAVSANYRNSVTGGGSTFAFLICTGVIWEVH